MRKKFKLSQNINVQCAHYCSDEHLCDNKELSPKEFIEMWLL